MNNTKIINDSKAIIQNNASSYIWDYNIEEFRKSALQFSTFGATNLNTTIDDLTAWELEVQKHLPLFNNLGETLYNKAKLKNNENIKYGLGVVISEYKGQQVFRHNGHDAGYRSHFLRIPNKKITILILSNNGKIQAGTIANKIADIFIHEKIDQKNEIPPTIETNKEWVDRRPSLYFNSKTAIARKIINKENALILQLGNGFMLESISDTEMRIKDRDYARFKFLKSDKGSEILIERIGAAPEEIYDKVQEYSPLKEELENYTGHYYSHELRQMAEIILSNDTLQIVTVKGNQILEPCFKNCFLRRPNDQIDSIQNMSIQFNDNNGVVDNFTISTRDVRNLCYKKVSVY